MSRPCPVTLITGGAQGIGRAIALKCLDAGHAVTILDTDEEAGLEVVTSWKEANPCRFLHTDVAEEHSVRTAIEDIVTQHGRLDHVVNNAGIARNRPITELGLDEWNRVLAVNLTGAFLTCKYAAPYLRTAGGAVVNISSTRARMSEANTEAYSASKGGLIALTHALAISLGPEVRVNSISPGWIEVHDWQKASQNTAPELSPEDHAQHPVGRVGRPDDVAELVLYLCSDKAGFITGQDFVVDGGMTRKMIYVE